MGVAVLSLVVDRQVGVAFGLAAYAAFFERLRRSTATADWVSTYGTFAHIPANMGYMIGIPPSEVFPSISALRLVRTRV